MTTPTAAAAREAIEVMPYGDLLAHAKAVLALHKPRTVEHDTPDCSACPGTWDDNYEVAWPCATVAALTGLPQG